MFLLYVDESGDPENADCQHFVLAGIAVFERQTYWLSQQLDALETETLGSPAADGDPYERPVEFHAQAINARKTAPWNDLKQKDSNDVLFRIAQLIADSHATCALFGVVVHRRCFEDENPIDFAFRDIVNRFDIFLARQRDQPNRGDQQRGLMICDENRYEGRMRTLHQSCVTTGGPFGRVRNFSDVPFFADSRASRMIQLADFIAWATWRRYERGDTRFFDIIASRFDARDATVHGLYHRSTDHTTCMCPACFSRRSGT